MEAARKNPPRWAGFGCFQNTRQPTLGSRVGIIEMFRCEFMKPTLFAQTPYGKLPSLNHANPIHESAAHDESHAETAPARSPPARPSHHRRATAIKGHATAHVPEG